MKKSWYHIALIVLLIIFGCKEEEIPPKNALVIEGYLIADAPIDKIQLTRLGGFSQDAENIPINDALMGIFKNGQEPGYLLEHIPGSDGRYRYNGNELTVDEGARYDIFIVHQEDTLIASTVVPPKPVIAGSSSTIISAFENTPGPNALAVAWFRNHVFWSPVIRTLEDDPVEIPRDDNEVRFSFSIPSVDTIFTITQDNLTWFGQNAFVTYSVNNEYVLLFDGNNPENFFETPTNIQNGFGIFTAFNTDTLVFEVVP